MAALRLVTAALALALLGDSVATWGSASTAGSLLDDVASPYRWCDAADALEAAGEPDRAAYAYDRGVALGSHEGPVLLRDANFQLTRPDPRAALPHFARLLQLLPDYDGAVFSTYQAMRFPVSEVLRRGLPPQSRTAQAYFNFLLSHDAAPADLGRAWQWLGIHHLRADREAGLYAASLLRAREYDEAVRMWSRFAGIYLDRDSVFNGGFETAPKPSPLDWTLASDQGRLDPSEPYGGRQALRIDFQGSANLNFHHVWQTLVAGPGTYRLEAEVKTAGVTTDEGLRLHLFDAERPSRLEFWSESLSGTHPWTWISHRITLLPGTRLVVLQICRRPSLKFDNKVAGTAWVDAVSLARL